MGWLYTMMAGCAFARPVRVLFGTLTLWFRRPMQATFWGLALRVPHLHSRSRLRLSLEPWLSDERCAAEREIVFGRTKSSSQAERELKELCFLTSPPHRVCTGLTSIDG